MFPVSDRHAGSLSVEETAVNVFCRISFAAGVGIMHLYANACFALTDVCYFIYLLLLCARNMNVKVILECLETAMLTTELCLCEGGTSLNKSNQTSYFNTDLIKHFTSSFIFYIQYLYLIPLF